MNRLGLVSCAVWGVLIAYAPQWAQAGSVLIDFGNNSSFRGTNVVNPDPNGNSWNSVWSGAYASNLLDVDGNTTSIGLGFSSAGATDYYNGPSGATRDPAAVVIDAAALGDLGVNEAVYDFYANSTFTIQGLDAGKTYDLTFYASRKYVATPTTVFTVYTSNDYATAVASTSLLVRSASNSSLHNSNTVVTISGVSPQYNDSLWIGFEGDAGGTGYLNAMKLSWTDAEPEPVRVLVDLGNNSSFRGTNVVNPDENGYFWNSVWSGTYASNLLDVEGNATSFGFGFSDAGGTDYFNGPSGATQDPTAVVIDAAALSYLGAQEAVYDFYTSSKFAIQGLDAGETYDVTFYGARRYATDAATVYTLYTSNDFVTAVTSASLNVRSPSESWKHNSNTVVTLTGVSPQYSDSLWIGFEGAGGNAGYLNALMIATAASDGGTPPALTRSPASLSYTTMAGVDPASQTFSVTNSGGGTLAYTNTISYSDGSGWLSVTPTTGTHDADAAANTHTVAVDVDGLAAGSYAATIQVAGNGGTAATVPVSLTVTNIPTPSAAVSVLGTRRTRYAVSDAAGRDLLVVYRAGAAPSAHPTQGQAYAQGASLGGGTVLYAGAGVTNTHTVAADTVHYYRVYSVANDHYSSASSVTVTTTVLAATGDATVLVDFGNASSYRGASVSNPDVNGNYWNSVWSGAYANNLVDSAGVATDIGLGFSDAGPTDYFNGPSGATADPEAVVIDAEALGNLAAPEAVYDYYASSQFTVQGLDGNRTYDLTFFGSRKFAAESNTVYTLYTSNDYAVAVTSVTLFTQSPSNAGLHNQDAVATLSGVSPQYSDSFWIGYEGANGGNGYLNALRIDYGTNELVAAITRSPASLSFATVKGSDPAAQTFSVTNSGVDVLAYTNSISYSDGAGWLSVSPVSGVHTAGQAAANSHTVSVSVAGLAVGSYGATIALAGNDGAAASLPVTLTVSAIPAPTASLTKPSAAVNQLTFSAADGRDVLVVYRAGSAPAADPVDGESYAVDAALGGGTVIYNGAAGTFAHTVVLNADHYYRLYAINNDQYSAATALTANSAVTRRDGEKNILIDFGSASSYRGASVSNPDVNGNTWNSIWSGAYFSNLLYRDGATSSVSIGFSSAGDTDYFNGPSGATADPDAVVIDAAALGELGVNEAVYDYYASSTFTIQNLDTNRTYELTFYGARKYATDAATVYTVYTSNDYAVAVTSASLNVRSPSASWLHNSNSVVTITNVSPQHNQSLWIGYIGAGESAGYLNALRLTFIDVQVPVLAAAASVGTNGFAASWSDVDAGSYRLDVSTSAGFDALVEGYDDREVNGTSLVISGLTPGQTYYFRVRGVFNGEASGSSVAQSVILPGSERPGVSAEASSSTQAVYQVTQGVTYDKYYSDDGGATWNLLGSETAGGSSLSLDLDEGDSANRVFTVKPSGVSPGASDVTGAQAVVKPAIAASGGYTLMAVPVSSDGDLQGDLGTQLAAGLANGSKLYVMSSGASPTWATFTLNNGDWVRSPAGSYVLAAGQAFYLENAGTNQTLRFSGSVGNSGDKTASLSQGYNLIGIAEGRSVAASAAFESASPTGTLSEVNFDETASDIVYIQRENGSWRRLIRRADGTWYDTDNPNQSSNTDLQLQPGQAYYYLRRGDATSLSF